MEWLLIFKRKLDPSVIRAKKDSIPSGSNKNKIESIPLKFHKSGAAGQKNGQFNRKKNWWTPNIERPTSNNVFCQFKIDGASLVLRMKGLRRPRVILPFEILQSSILLFSRFKIDKAQRHQYSTFDVGRSMFNVRSFHCFGQAEFHASSASNLKSG